MSLDNVDSLHELRKRIDHIAMTTGKVPNVLDVPACEWERLLAEVDGLPRYMAPPRWGDGPLEVGERPPVIQLDLFGIRIVKGRA